MQLELPAAAAPAPARLVEEAPVEANARIEQEALGGDAGDDDCDDDAMMAMVLVMVMVMMM